MRAALLLASARAGRADSSSLAAVAAVLSLDFRLDVVRTADTAGLDAALDGLDGRLLVVAGGDGSLHAAVAALQRRGELADADLALVPLGTGNDFAQTIGIPLEPADAAAVISGSVRRPLDLLVDTAGDVVVNVVHAGVGAEAAEVAAGLKGTLGPAAYPLGALIAAAAADGWSESVEVDGTVVHDAAPVLMVGICNGRTIGGGAPLCALADPGDGLVDVVVVTAVELSARIAFGADLRKGAHLGRDDVLHTRGRSVTVRGAAIGYNADGEISPPVGVRRFEVLPGAWTLRAPAV